MTGLSGGDKEEILRQSAAFLGITENDLKELTGLAVTRHFNASEFIFWEGDSPDWFYIIATGKVKVHKHSSLGKEFIIAFFGPGEMFGEIAVFENKPYPVSAQAMMPTTIIGIKRDDMLFFMEQHPQVALRIINILGERLRDAQGRLRDLAGERVEQRLASMLIMLSNKLGLTLPFTRQEIADMTGTTIETAIRVMSRFKERGIINTVRGQVTIRDKEKLRVLSEGPPRV